MPSGIGSCRRRENSGGFVGSRLREERKGQSPVNPHREPASGRVLRVCKHYAVREDLSSGARSRHRFTSTWACREDRPLRAPVSRTSRKTIGAIPGTSIPRGRLLYVIDHQQVNQSLPGLQLESELFL